MKISRKVLWAIDFFNLACSYEFPKVQLFAGNRFPLSLQYLRPATCSLPTSIFAGNCPVYNMDDRSSVVDLLALDATQLQQLMEQGQLTSVSLVRQILAQVDRENHTGMRLNAMISVARETLLLETAAQLDVERERARSRTRASTRHPNHRQGLFPLTLISVKYS